MANTLKLSLLVSTLLILPACSESEFASGAKAKGGKKSDGKSDGSGDADLETSTEEEKVGSEGEGNSESSEAGGSESEAEEDENILTSDEAIIRRQECWFAVSGTWLGPGGSHYASKFPSTTSGNPIAHGEKFDTVGGIYLTARDEPYIHGKGAKEIDLAIAQTFDGIAVAPGLHAIIKNAAGTVLADKKGPWLAQDVSYSTGTHASRMYNGLKTGTGMPKWIQDYTTEKTSVDAIPLHSAREVLVKVAPGERCDFVEKE